MISDQYNLKQFAPLFLNKISVSVGLRQSKQSLLQICVPVVVKINTISYVICHFLLSRSMRSAWIEIPTGGATRSALWGRAPCGARGLKCHRHRRQTVARSRAPCGARGLKYMPVSPHIRSRSRAPCGARGLKSSSTSGEAARGGRAPCGARGLKL